MNNSSNEQEKYIRKSGEGTTLFFGSPGDEIISDHEMVTFYEFTVDAPKKHVWNVIKNQNAWIHDMEWDLVVGDQSSQGKKVTLSPKDITHNDGSEIPPHTQKVLNVIPEQLLITSDPVSSGEEGTINGGVYVTTLAEHDGVTTVTTTMVKQTWTQELSQEAIDSDKYWVDSINKRWEEHYIPKIRQLVMES